MNAQEQKELTDMAVGWLGKTCRSGGCLDDCGDPECAATREAAHDLLTWLRERVQVAG